MRHLSYAVLLPFSCLAFSTIANTDVYIADIKMNNGKYKLEQVKNITARSGYDNQPNFAPDNSGLYYTAMYQITDKKFQTDTMFYRFADEETRNVSQTWDTSEYSPTPFNQGKSLSFIKVETDGTQRLWSMTVNDAQQRILNEDIKPVGYHAWGENDELALFVLGEPMTLQYIKKPSQKAGETVAGNIGRSIRYNASHQKFSYSFGDKQQTLATFDPKSGKTTSLLTLPKDAEYYTWLDDQRVLSAEGNKIMVWNYQSGNPTAHWRLFADVSQHCETKVSRLAVNNTATKIAFVCDEKSEG